MNIKKNTQPLLVLTFAVIMVTLLSFPECQAVTLTITANNGSVTATPDKADYSVGEVVELMPKPDTGYSFAGWAGDARGKRLVLNLTMDSDKAITANFDTWQPPIGIPDPGWGIDDDVNSYYGDGTGATYDYSDDEVGAVAYRLTSRNEPYTHYIDPDDGSATDTDNPHGTEAVPRLTYPSNMRNLPAGSVVEIHSDLGSMDGYTGKMEGDGTLAAPIFIRGTATDKPVLTTLEDYTMWPSGDYYIIENIDFDGDHAAYPKNPQFIYQDQRGSGAKTHLAVRGCEFHNTMDVPLVGGFVIKVVGTPGAETQVENFVFYNNSFHHLGEGRTLSQDEGGKDVKGIGSFGGVKHVWILNNEFYEMAAAAAQTMFQDATSDHPEFIYFGDNTIHDTFESAFSCKDGKNVIISQNVAYNYGTEHTGDYEDNAPFTCTGGGGETGEAAAGKQNIWYLFNTVYDCTTAKGAFASYTAGTADYPTELYYIGNVIYDVVSPDGDAVGFYGYWRRDIYWIANVLYNVDTPFSFSLSVRTYHPSDSIATFVNNIIGDLPATSKHGQHMRISGNDAAHARAVYSHNLFYESSGDAIINRRRMNTDGTPISFTDYTIDEWETAFSTQAVGFIEADPMHTDPANGDFSLLAASAAIDAGTSSGIVQQVFDRFEQLYGIDIRKDMEGISRPQGAGWDIGAYEYGASGFLYGDVSENGAISATDAAMAARYAVGLISLTADQITKADVSGNGSISAADAGWIA
ncbi:dockerin type I domain-containing protein, partial [Candidatus Omnitrophota bacterium]